MGHRAIFARLFFVDTRGILFMKHSLPQYSEEDIDNIEKFDEADVAEVKKQINAYHDDQNEERIKFLFKPFTGLDCHHGYVLIRDSCLAEKCLELRDPTTQQYSLELWHECSITVIEEQLNHSKSESVNFNILMTIQKLRQNTVQYLKRNEKEHQESTQDSNTTKKQENLQISGCVQEEGEDTVENEYVFEQPLEAILTEQFNAIEEYFKQRMEIISTNMQSNLHGAAIHYSNNLESENGIKLPQELSPVSWCLQEVVNHIVEEDEEDHPLSDDNNEAEEEDREKITNREEEQEPKNGQQILEGLQEVLNHIVENDNFSIKLIQFNNETEEKVDQKILENEEELIPTIQQPQNQNEAESDDSQIPNQLVAKQHECNSQKSCSVSHDPKPLPTIFTSETLTTLIQPKKAAKEKLTTETSQEQSKKVLKLNQIKNLGKKQH